MSLATTTVGASTYERIRHDIIFGSLRPGVKLKLDPLRKNYGVSVTTLREILNRLVSEGFVRAEEQRGFFVSSVSRVDLIEISNLRIYPPPFCFLKNLEYVVSQIPSMNLPRNLSMIFCSQNKCILI